ncbi:MAG: 3-hydroxylacyl-ACP dehydratase [Treponema sp.]|nr:3-hydroxylacyl-ACP dehydratase [Treponema sp.]
MSEKVCTIPQFIDHDDLIWMLPHKGKMFLLSRVTQHDGANHTITSEYDITKDCIFYEEEFDGVPTWAGFEFMAQGISALTGITNKEKGREPLPGFILSVVDFKAEVGFLKNGTTIQMKIREDFREEADHIYRYVCELYAHVGDAAPAASAKITVMETEDIHALFKD